MRDPSTVRYLDALIERRITSANTSLLTGIAVGFLFVMRRSSYPSSDKEQSVRDTLDIVWRQW